jgi:hypothetical protein
MKNKAAPLRHARAKEDISYSSYSFLNSALDGVCGQRHAPAALYPRRRPTLHFVEDVGWAS